MLQSFQSVKINNPDNADHGRAGTVRHGQPVEVTIGDAAAPVLAVLVQLDGDTEPRHQACDDLQLLA